MSDVTARILLWGIAGAGKTATLEKIYAKLRPDLRGELRHEPTRLDPTVHYEALPIMLGQVGGVGTRIEIIAVPGAEDQVLTRKQLLDRIDGVILVLDCSPERIEENWSAIRELKDSLEDYGRSLEELPMVLQYNKRDIADPFAIEDLHRRVGLEQSAVFETIATTGHGILAALTTISKHVVRSRRGQASARPLRVEPDPASSMSAAPSDAHPIHAVAEDPHASSHEILEAAILAEAEEVEAGHHVEALELDLSPPSVQPNWDRTSDPDAKPEGSLSGALRVVSVGQATLDGEGGIRVPLVLGDAAGQTRSVLLSLRLDPLLDDGGD